MRNKAISIILTLIMVVGMAPVASITASADDEVVDVTVSGIANYDYANEVVELVNEERAAEGLDPLVMDEKLTECAMQRAAEQAFYFGHVRPDGTGWDTVANDYNFEHYVHGGENAAGNYKTPTAVMDGWMNSEGHKVQILDSRYDTIGVGCVTNNGYTYWVQWFAAYGEANERGGYAFAAVQSTYSGSQEQTFTVSVYTSYLDSAHITGGSYKGYEIMVENAAETQLQVTNGRDGYSYMQPIIHPIASDVKDESTGEVIATTSVASNGKVIITAKAVGTGYLYLYAYEGAAPKSVKVTTYKGNTVTFDSCGGSSVSSQTVKHYASEPTEPTRDGYTFAGWYTAADGGTEYEFDSDGFSVLQVESDMTLYAHWTANTTGASNTTKAEETTTAASETTTTKSEETTTSPTEAVTEETTAAQDSDSEPSSELQDSGSETSSEPQDSNSEPDEETTGTPDESETTEPEETAGKATDGVIEATETEAVTDDTETEAENTYEKSDTDNAALANDGDDNGNTVADKENGSNAWIVVLVVVLLIAAAGVTVFVVLKRNKNGDEIADTAEIAETENDNVENDNSTDGNADGDGE